MIVLLSAFYKLFNNGIAPLYFVSYNGAKGGVSRRDHDFKTTFSKNPARWMNVRNKTQRDTINDLRLDKSIVLKEYKIGHNNGRLSDRRKLCQKKKIV